MSWSPLHVAVFAVVLVAAAQGAVGSVAAEDVTLEITVVDRNGNEQSDVTIVATWNGSQGGPRTATTSADGRALLDVPRGADVEIRTDDEEFARNRPFRINDARSGSVRVPVSEGGRASIVVEGADGPIPEASVEIRDAAGRVDRQTTDEEGVARTEIVEIGEYTVRVTAPGHLRENVEIEITQVEETRTVELEEADVDATVTVVDDHFDDPRPVANATVEVDETGATATTGADGTATLPVSVNTRPRIVVSRDGYGTAGERLDVAEDPVSVAVAVQRSPGVNVETINRRVVVGESTVVTVTDQYDRPLSGATVRVGGESVGETDDEGRLRVTVESAGNVTLEASSDGVTGSATVEGIDPSAEGSPTATATGSTPTAAPGNGTETPGASGPGFGALAALVALCCVALLRDRR
jgi:PGF-CTERM protein